MERVGELIIDGLVLWAIMVAVWLLIWHGVAWLFRKRVDRVVQGSNDNETWTTLDVQENLPELQQSGTYEVKHDSTYAFRYYKLTETTQSPVMKALRFVLQASARQQLRYLQRI